MENEFSCDSIAALINSMDSQSDSYDYLEGRNITKNQEDGKNNKKSKITISELNEIISNAEASCNVAAKVIQQKIQDFPNACQRPSVQQLCNLQHQQLQVLGQMVEIRKDMEQEENGRGLVSKVRSKVSLVTGDSPVANVANTISKLRKTVENTCCICEAKPQIPCGNSTMGQNNFGSSASGGAFPMHSKQGNSSFSLMSSDTRRSRLPRWQPTLLKKSQGTKDGFKMGAEDLILNKTNRMRSGCCLETPIKSTRTNSGLNNFCTNQGFKNGVQLQMAKNKCCSLSSRNGAEQQRCWEVNEDLRSCSNTTFSMDSCQIDCDGPCTCNDPLPQVVDEISGHMNGNEFEFKIHRDKTGKKGLNNQAKIPVQTMVKNINPVAFKVYPTQATVYPPSCVTPDGTVKTTLANNKSFRLTFGKLSAGNDDINAGVDVELRRKVDEDIQEPPELTNAQTQYLLEPEGNDKKGGKKRKMAGKDKGSKKKKKK